MDSWTANRKPEQSRIGFAVERIPSQTNRYDHLVTDLHSKIHPLTSRSIILETGLQLWQHAIADVQSGHLDDRPLYWTRLKMINLLREAGLDHYVRDFEYSSRGLLHRPNDPATNVILTGFDPFGLEKTLTQSNPSGLIALALAGQHSPTIALKTAVFPVRFLDFEQDAIVETYLSEVVSPSTVLVITCSMGRNQFDIERYVIGRRTSSAQDNCNLVRSDEAINVVDPTQNESFTGSRFHEFLESALPVHQFSKDSEFGPWKTKFNGEVETLERGVFEAQSLKDLRNQTAKQGSGGGFLSNEISYRSLLWRKRRRSNVPMGHIHVPRIDGYDHEKLHQIQSQFREIFDAIIRELDLVESDL